MRHILLMPLLFIVLIGLTQSCKRINQGYLQGKWAGKDQNGDYMEIWLSDDMALTYSGAKDEVSTYTYKVSDTTLSLHQIGNFSGVSGTYTLEIQSLSESLLILMSDGSDQGIIYHHLSGEKPSISKDIVANKHFAQKQIAALKPVPDTIINRLGFSCGENQWATRPVYLMKENLIRRDFESLRQSLYSADSTEKFLAYIALKQLNKNGIIQIDTQTKRQMQQLRMSDEPVPVCYRSDHYREVPLSVLLEKQNPHLIHAEAEAWIQDIIHEYFHKVG